MEFKKRRKKMRSAMAMLLAVMMIVGLMPISAKAAGAAATNISVENAEYYDTGALKSITSKFTWSTGSSANVQLVLMKQKLNTTTTANPDYGDFTDYGTYGWKFKSLEEAKKYDAENENIFGIVANSADTKDVQDGKSYSFEISFDENDIPLNVNGYYYVYLWTYLNSTRFYPDNLLCVIQVNDGAVNYTEAEGRNGYDESAFNPIISQTKYSVTVTPADHMTRVESSGEAEQTELAGAMTPVSYTADTGYYFPEDYAVETVKGVMVRRDSESQITVYGTPTADAEITLAAPTRRVAANLEEVTFNYAYDVQRTPAIPTKDDNTMTVKEFAVPLKADGTNRYGSNSGTWTLSKMGTYSGMQNNELSSVKLSGIVDKIVSYYGLSSEKSVVIHELKNGDEHVAYGVVISYDAAGGSAVFLGDNLGGLGAGYLLSVDSVTGPTTINVGSIATDFINAEVPDAVFEAADDNSGTLKDVDSSMVYSVDGGENWNSITGTTVELTDLSDGDVIQIKRSGDGEITTDSAVQEITITQAAAPTLSKEDCTTSSQNDGKITGVDETMEYRLSTATDWTAITGEEVTGLANGTYEVRVKANGTVLASPATTVTVAAHVCTAKEDTWHSDGTNHWKECACGEKVDVTAHSVGTTGTAATCTAQATCGVCGESYGSKDSNNHTGDEVWEQTADTHKKVYDCCGVVAVEEAAHTWENGKCTTCGYPCNHTGGTATCTQKAICEKCGSSYGELDSTNHKPATAWIQEKGKHYHVCENGCGTHLNEENCSGGEATCKNKAVCETCKHSYGELDSDKHEGKAVWEQTADTHKKVYDCCGVVAVEEAAHTWENGICTECEYECKHAGGEATCTQKAECSICGEKYGELDLDNHTGVEEWEQTADTHKKVYDCCGKVTIEEAAHTFEWIVDKEATATEKGSKHEECAVCGYQKAAVEIPATGVPAKPIKPEKQTEKAESNAVETGDNAPLGVVLAMLLLSAAGMTVLTVERKKKYRR